MSRLPPIYANEMVVKHCTSMNAITGVLSK